MRLLELDPALSQVCRTVEMRTRDFVELATVELPVETKPDFDSLDEAKSSRAIRRSPVVYRLRDRSIIVNGSEFFRLQGDIAEAALAHEIGHAVIHRDSLMQVVSYRLLGECIVADLLACRWGFFSGLKKERLAMYGKKYSEILELWSNEKEFLRRMSEWYQLYLAGLINKPKQTDDR